MTDPTFDRGFNHKVCKVKARFCLGEIDTETNLPPSEGISISTDVENGEPSALGDRTGPG